MLELTTEQVAALADIDAKGFVERVRQDLSAADPKLADDSTLSSRLWRAFKAARGFGIHEDENLAAFLRIEAYAPNFYEKPATRACLTRPDRSADERFHDYFRVMRWKIQHPDYVGGLTNGGTSRAGSGSGSSGTRPDFGARWRGFIGWGGDGRNG